MEAVVQLVTVEGPARARLKLDLPIRPLGGSTGPVQNGVPYGDPNGTKPRTAFRRSL